MNNFDPNKPLPPLITYVAYGTLREAGFKVVHDPTWHNYSHCTLGVQDDVRRRGDDSEKLAEELREKLRLMSFSAPAHPVPDCKRCETDPLCLRVLYRIGNGEPLCTPAECNVDCDVVTKCVPPCPALP